MKLSKCWYLLGFDLFSCFEKILKNNHRKIKIKANELPKIYEKIFAWLLYKK
jgi:hypothetical protein